MTLVTQIPNVLTLLNLSSGFIAITFALQGRYEYSLIFMLISLVFDGLDGKLASYLNCKSHFGTELDAFADVVSFAVLPGLSIYYYISSNRAINSSWGILIGLAYTIPGVLRLARFNVYQEDKGTSRDFTGLPMPPLGILIISVISLANIFPTMLNPFLWFAFVPLIIIGSYLMISKVKYKKYGKSQDTTKTKIIVVFLLIALLFLVAVYYYIGEITTILISLCIILSFTYIIHPIFSATLMILNKRSK